MRFISNPEDINSAVTKLIKESNEIYIATAWASDSFESYEALINNQHKIMKLIIGTHFYQTHPNVLRDFKDHSSVRFVLNTNEIFHPKIYIFKSNNKYDCLIGSSNFTRGGFIRNYEIMVHLTNDVIPIAEIQQLLTKFNDYWNISQPITDEILDNYTVLYKKKQPTIHNRQGLYLSQDNLADGGISPLQVPILNMSWNKYIKTLKDERSGEAIIPRLEMIEDVQR